MRLAQLDVAGNHAIVQHLQDIVVFQRNREQVLLPIAQSPDADASGLQIVDQHTGAGHDACE